MLFRTVVPGPLAATFLHRLQQLVRDLERVPEFGRGPGGQDEELVITIERRSIRRKAVA